jgi:hypothetical protein
LFFMYFFVSRKITKSRMLAVLLDNACIIIT